MDTNTATHAQASTPDGVQDLQKDEHSLKFAEFEWHEFGSTFFGNVVLEEFYWHHSRKISKRARVLGVL